MDSLSGWLRKNIKKQNWRKLKGIQRDPFFYLGFIAVVLFSIISFSVSFDHDSQSPILRPGFQSNGGSFATPGAIVKESPDLSLIQKNSLAAVSPPIMVTPQVLGALVGGTNYEAAKNEIVEYVVEPGDNLWSIAEKFNISLDTLLWANDLDRGSVLKIGQKLVILPTSGVIYHVRSGDTLSAIAKTFKADMEEIVTFNELSDGGDIYIGDILIIPKGIMPPPIYYAPSSIPLASSYFICPIGQPCRITQGLHWYNAVDFSHQGIGCGEPIFAAAGGIIQKSGYDNRSGNYLRILHPNGVVTYYGHLQNAAVSLGQKVNQGQIIGYMGYSGYTVPAGPAGCHLHFGVHGAANPFVK